MKVGETLINLGIICWAMLAGVLIEFAYITEEVIPLIIFIVTSYLLLICVVGASLNGREEKEKK
jgi:hypothetical protein